VHAILLADRVVVMGEGCLTLDVAVPLEPPRRRGQPGFVALRDRLLGELGVVEPGSDLGIV
jgi:sulfonate transport system ATP-binding protein